MSIAEYIELYLHSDLPFVTVNQFEVFLGVVDGNNRKIAHTTSLSNANKRIQFQNIALFSF